MAVELLPALNFLKPIFPSGDTLSERPSKKKQIPELDPVEKMVAEQNLLPSKPPADKRKTPTGAKHSVQKKLKF